MVFLVRTRIRAHGHSAAPVETLEHGCQIPFSSIRTVTVGFGVAPNLLTLPKAPKGIRQALAGLSPNHLGLNTPPGSRLLPPVGTFTPP